MKTLLIVTLIAATGLAAENKLQMMMGPDGKPAPVHHGKMGEVRKAIYKIKGGNVAIPGTQKGSIVVVNCRADVPTNVVWQTVSVFAGFTKYNLKMATGEFKLPRPAVQGEASLFVVDDPELPSLLHAPENRWVAVNVNGLRSGRGEDVRVFAARIQKELARGLALLCGSQTSQYPSSLMGCITKPEDLDQFLDCRLPVDIMDRIRKYPVGYGITAAQETYYRKTCQEGWAPAPTDTVQKAIWEKVHTIPSKPIKIEYNEKRDKGK